MGNSNSNSNDISCDKMDSPPELTNVKIHNDKNDKNVKKTSWERFTKWIKTKLEDNIGENSYLPGKYSDRVPYYYKFITFGIAWLSFLIILCCFTYIGYVQDQSTKYISLDPTIYAQDSSSPYRHCEAVANSLTGTWTLDKNGYWNGMSGFLGGFGRYKFQFSDFKHTYDSYYTFMSEIKNKIAVVGSGATSRTSAQNLAYLMSCTYVKSDGYDQRVTFVGDPVYVFNRFYKSASMGSTSFPCKAIPSIALDKSTGIFTVKYAYGEATEFNDQLTTCPTPGSGYISSAEVHMNGCGGTGCCQYYNPASPSNDTKTFDEKWCVIPPGDFAYNSAFDADYFTLKYNIWSLMTAYAVNQGIIDFSVLEEVEIGITNNIIGCYSLNSECSTDALNGASKCSISDYGLSYDSSNNRCFITHPTTKANYYATARIDVRYPGMDAIVCMVKVGDTVPTVCLLRMGNAFVLPYFNHMGTSNIEDFYSWKDICACSKPSIPTKYTNFYDSTMFSTNNGQFKGQYNGYCSQFDLIHGFVIFKSNHYEDHLMFNIILATEYTASEIDTMAYYAGFVQLRLGGNAAQNPQSSGTTNATALLTKMMSKNVDNSLSFCTGLPGLSTPTSCSIFAMNTYDEFDTRINSDGVIAPFTSCVNNFEIDDTAWDSGIYDDDDYVGPKAGDGALRLPPSSLIQKYYECFNTEQSSLLFAFGSASGSAGTIQPFFITIFVLFTLRFVLKKKNIEVIEVQEPRIQELKMRAKYNSEI
jgi:hypothetical protein